MMELAARIGFRGRLIAATVALVAVVSLSIGALLMLYLFEDEQSRAMEQLRLGERVAKEVLQRRTSLIYSRLDVVVRDFGFRSALASRDRVTADSALENQSRRLGAGFALVVDSDGNTLAAADDPPDRLLNRAETLNLLTEAQVDGFASESIVLDDQAIELVTIPIQAPGLRAQLIAGFEIGQETAEVIERLSGTEVLYQARNHNTDDFRLLNGTRHIEDAELATLSAGQSNARFFARVVNLSTAADTRLQLLLLIDRKATLDAYYKRAVEILLLIGSVLSLAVVIALVVARSLGKPVLTLAQYAKDIGDGESPEPPPLKVGGELAQLRNALGDMLYKLKDREQQIRYAASHDEITGLPNAHAFLNSVREGLLRGRSFRLFGLRINDLSNINDTLGLAFGDQVLRAVATRLQHQVPDHTDLARTGGGEFLMLTEACNGNALGELAHALLDAVQAPMQINNTPFTLRCMMVSLQLPEDAQDTDELRRRLNLTFEQAKSSRQKITYYEPGRDEDHLRELQIISDLTTAIAENGLHMNYQPKLSITDGSPTQVEALIRWNHPQLGFISPEEFIFLAEQSGQIIELTRHILNRVASDASQWHSSGLRVGVAINLSALDLVRPELIDEVAGAFSDWQLPMSDITLEVTESALMEDPKIALETLNRLRSLGVTLSVDDFGTGYSSLSQLRKLPVQELKIDKSFVLKLNTEPQDQLIVKSTIEMAHGLGLKTVAEGIENRETWHILKNWGCETGQGFYMSRPVAADKLADTLNALQTLKPELDNPGDDT